MARPPGAAAVEFQDDEKAKNAHAACEAAFRLLKTPAMVAKLRPEDVASLQAATNQAWFNLAVYRGELLKQQRRAAAPPVALGTTTTMGGGATTPFGALAAALAAAIVAIGAIAIIRSSSEQIASNQLDSSLSLLKDVATTTIETVPKPFPASPNIPRGAMDELIGQGIIIVESNVISIDFTTLRHKIVQTMMGIDVLMKQNKNDCDDCYNRVRDLALEILQKLQGGITNIDVFVMTRKVIEWMKAVNDLFVCLNIPGQGPPFPKVT
jgi:hypothetical protein